MAIFGDHLTRIAETYLRKGSKVYLEGRLETRKWQDQQGNDRYTTEVTLRPYRGELVLLGDRRGGGGSDGAGGGSSRDPDGASSGGGYGDHRNPPPGPGIDDDIPF